MINIDTSLPALDHSITLLVQKLETYIKPHNIILLHYVSESSFLILSHGIIIGLALRPNRWSACQWIIQKRPNRNRMALT